MPIDVHNLMAVLRGRALDRLEAGVRAGSDLMVEHLKATVSHPSGENLPVRGPASVTRFQYVDKSGRVRTARRKIEAWKTATQYLRGVPPHRKSGHGQDSIGYQIVDKNYEEGTITLRIGVDDSAPGGTQQLQSYLMAHELGIRYPTQRDAIKGPVIQHPWFRPTLNKYWSEMVATVILVSRGLM